MMNSDKTSSSTGWDGTISNLPPDTRVGVRKDSLERATLESEMRRVSELGNCVWIRYDRWREHHFFTILLNNERLCDTDDPIGALQEVI